VDGLLNNKSCHQTLASIEAQHFAVVLGGWASDSPQIGDLLTISNCNRAKSEHLFGPL
jgi:hypothetical protein